MTCPKCQGQMRTFDRQGVHIDRCNECSGVFLDRGELEQLMEAEQQHYGAPPPDPDQPRRPPQGGYAPQGGYGHGGYQGQPQASRPYPDSPKPFGSYPDSPPPYGRRKKKGFLEQLFD
ncbi:TFIIB-type zinc ribbon-containing protein [Halostreptopolyspora alba]|uniref:Transcriptional regulator n=1 Tax=Halostreptopolyspora alba TaxID=2487137 RepID=A0A3N0E837_9ACTN|nr:transcriptional regulator [Nocardiopsaceae bacterium YIM 96095]